MTKLALLSAILFFVSFATCHFQLQHPPSRAGEEDEKQRTFPCGGFDTVKDRTQFPLTGGSIQLELGHDRSLVEVLLALGNDPGDSFNIVWKPIIQEEGPGEFCLQNLNVPGSLNLKDGQNATIQVITDGHENSGLYNCADITFKNVVTGPPPPCKNGTNLRASEYKGEFTNANGTTAASTTTDTNDTTSDNSSSTQSTELGGAAPAAPSSPSSTPSSARKVEGGVWALLGALVMGGLALL